MSLRKQAVAGVKWNVVSTAVTVLVQFIILAVLTHLLSPGDFGLMGMVLVVTGLASTLADFGLSNAIIYQQDATREQLSSLYWVGIIVSWTLWGLIWLATPLAAEFFNQEAITTVLRGTSLTFLILPLGQQFQAMLRRDLHFDKLAYIRVVEVLVYGFSAILLAWMDYGVMSLVWATVLRSIVATGLLLFVGFRREWLPGFRFQADGLRGFTQFGLFQMGDRIVNYLGNNVDYLIIGRFLGVEALGYYTLAYHLMRVPQITINPIVVSVAFPAFARVQNQYNVLRKGYAKILSYLNAISSPLMAGMFVVAPLFIPVVYGDEWMPAVAVVQIFSLLGIIKSLGNPISSVLLAKGRADLGFYMNVIAVVGYTVSNLIGVRWGIVGVAVSSLCFTLVVLLPIDFYLRWMTIGMRAQEFWHAIKKSSFATCILVAVTMIVYFLAISWCDKIILLVALIVIGALTYLYAMWKIDREFLCEVWHDIRYR